MSRDLTVSWNELDRPRWDAVHAAAGAAYQQDWAYGEALRRSGARVLRAAVSDASGEVVALAQILARPFALAATLALCTYGPVWAPGASPETKSRAYRALKRALPIGWPRLLVFTPDEEREAPAGLPKLKRVMTGDATVLIDLTPAEDALRASLDGKWRNSLGKAEKSALKIARGGARPAQYRWLIQTEEKQRQSRGYRALPGDLVEAWQEAKGRDSVAVFRADLGKEAAAGMLFLVHGRRATYHIGWTSETGRDTAAHNALMWLAMRELKAAGVDLLDLGGVNTQSAAGIARFKLGTGGRVLLRAGAYV
jgi:hypothetical protein